MSLSQTLQSRKNRLLTACEQTTGLCSPVEASGCADYFEVCSSARGIWQDSLHLDRIITGYIHLIIILHELLATLLEQHLLLRRCLFGAGFPKPGHNGWTVRCDLRADNDALRECVTRYIHGRRLNADLDAGDHYLRWTHHWEQFHVPIDVDEIH